MQPETSSLNQKPTDYNYLKMNRDYNEFLNNKIKLAEKHGFEVPEDALHPILKPHQRDIIRWAINGGRRAVFASFGLGKTMIQLEIIRLINLFYIQEEKRNLALIVCPLAAQLEFFDDAEKLGIKDQLKYITSTDQIDDEHSIYITNYERIRQGNIDPSYFVVSTLDEASVLRSLDSQTSDTLNHIFTQIPFRYVCTATPSPNRYLELTHYADYLGIMDRGQILTRFFQRDSTKAGNLKLYDKREKEFWYWMSSWATFITKPSDLGNSDEGYDLPPIKINWHRVTFERDIVADRDGRMRLVTEINAGVGAEKSREDRESLPARADQMETIIKANPDDHFVIWHNLERERHEIQKRVKTSKAVWGSQNLDQRQDHMMGFRNGEYQYLSTKPSIAGSGCNFQYHCHRAIYLGIDDNFNDFIQSVHRIYRFMQQQDVIVEIIYTDAQENMRKRLETKWNQHLKLQNEMTDIIKKHGLNSELYKEDLKREMFKGRTEYKGEDFTLVNNDNVDEMPKIKDDSVDFICTSIPFGNHYEYSENYNCFGHNESNEEFFKQMDHLTPELFRALQPGRIAAIHVKDRIRYSYMNGAGFSTIEPFSDHTNLHFLKHGFHSIGRITITTDVVRENNQTYRLGHSEMCKDGSKMGIGIPEYVLLFRKPPSDKSNSYADLPVQHTKEEYPVSQWQLDAHAFWKSDGSRLFNTELLKQLGLDKIGKLWKELEMTENYSFETHIKLCKELDKIGKLPRVFMAIPPISTNPEVWTDINRMNTLNSEQAKKNMDKHICPLQLDIIKRLIERYTNKGDLVLDPFSGIGSTAYQAVKMERKGFGIELSTSYHKDAIKHCKGLEITSKNMDLFEMAV
jgi:DNA modification methylase